MSKYCTRLVQIESDKIKNKILVKMILKTIIKKSQKKNLCKEKIIILIKLAKEKML